MYDTLRKIWVPATVIHVLPWNSYQVCTSNGSTYHHMWRHLCECSVKAVNTVPSGTTATPQAPTRHCFSAPQPALAPPGTAHTAHLHCTCNTSDPDETGPSCPCHASCSKNALAPMSVTFHATPVQPQRSNHAHMAPRCLIQEI